MPEHQSCARPGCDERFTKNEPGILTLEAGGKRFVCCSHACLMWLLAYDPEIGALGGAPLLGRTLPPTQYAASQRIPEVD